MYGNMMQGAMNQVRNQAMPTQGQMPTGQMLPQNTPVGQPMQRAMQFAQNGMQPQGQPQGQQPSGGLGAISQQIQQMLQQRKQAGPNVQHQGVPPAHQQPMDRGQMFRNMRHGQGGVGGDMTNPMNAMGGDIRGMIQEMLRKRQMGMNQEQSQLPPNMAGGLAQLFQRMRGGR